MDMPPKVRELLNGTNPAAAKTQLDRLSVEELFAPQPLASRPDALLVKAAIYLKHGFLDECHRIAQKVETSTGSYWHALMHRAEGDFSNAKYWFRRVSQHPVLSELGTGFDPFRYVDACAAGTASAADRDREFTVLCAHTLAAAIGPR
ncbi:hypothetical protein HQ590_02345 [bacterium]|nr:hypothetical protein [bacterium]